MPEISVKQIVSSRDGSLGLLEPDDRRALDARRVLFADYATDTVSWCQHHDFMCDGARARLYFLAGVKPGDLVVG